MKLDFISHILSGLLLFLIVNNVVFGQISQRSSHPLLSSLFRTANEVNGPNAAPIRPVRKPSYSVHDAKRFFDKFSENFHREAATRSAIIVPRITSTFHPQRPDTSGSSLLSQSARHELLTNGIRTFHQNLPCIRCKKYTQRRLHIGTMGNTNRHMSAGSSTVAGSIFGGPYFPAQTTGHLSSIIHTNELSPASQAVPPSKSILSNEFHAQSERSRNPQELINQIPSQVLNDMIQSPAADVKQDFSHIYNVLETPSSGAPMQNNPAQDMHFDSSRVNIAIDNAMVPSSVHSGPMSNSGSIVESSNTNNQIIDSQIRGLNGLGRPINNNVQDLLPIPNGFVPPEINSVTNAGFNEGTVGFNQHQASPTPLLDPTLNFNNGFRQPDVSLQIPSLLPTQQEETFLDMQQTNEVLPAGMDLIGRGIDLVRSNDNDNTRLLENPSIIPSLGIIGDILQGDISSVNSEGLQGVMHSSSVDGLPIDSLNPNQNFPQPSVNRNGMPWESGIGPITHNSGQLSERFPQQVDMGIDLPSHNQLVADNIISHSQQIQNGFITGPEPHESINHGSDVSQIMPVDGAPGKLEGASPLPELNNGNPSPNQNMPHLDNTMIDTLAVERAPIDISHDAPDGFLNVGFIPENSIVEQPNAIPVNKAGMPVTDAHVDAVPIHFDSPLNTDGGFVDLNSDINNIIDHQQAVHMKEMSNQNQQVDILTGAESSQVIEPTTGMQQHDGSVMPNVDSPDWTLTPIEPGVAVTNTVSDNQIDPAHAHVDHNNQVAVDQNQPEFGGETIQVHPLPELIPQGEHLGISFPTEPSFNDNFNSNSVSSDNVLDSVVPKLMNSVNGIRHVELITEGEVPFDGQAEQAQNNVDIVGDISQDNMLLDTTHNAGDGFIDAIPEGHANIQNNKPVHAKEISHPHILVDSIAESTMIPDPQSELPTDVDIVKPVDSLIPQHSSESGGIPIQTNDEIFSGIVIDNAVSNSEQPGHIEVQTADPVVIVKTVPVAETPVIFQRQSLQNEEIGITEHNTETHNAVTDSVNGIQKSSDIPPPIFVPVLNDNADSIIVPKADLQSEKSNLQHEQTVGADVMTKGDIHVHSDASILNAKDIGQGLIDNPVRDPQQEVTVPTETTGETAHDQTLHLLDLLSGGIDPHIDHSNHGLDQHPVVVDDNFKPTISPDASVKPIVASAETIHFSDIDVATPELSGVPVTILDISVKPDINAPSMEQTDLHNMLSQPDHHSNIDSISLAQLQDTTGDHMGTPKVETIPGHDHLPVVTNAEIHRDGTGHRDVLLKLEDLMMGITDSSNHGHPNLNKEIKPTVASSMPGEHNHEPKGKHVHETGNEPILLFTTELNADNTGLNHGDVLLKLNNLMMGVTESSAVNPNHEHHGHNKEHKPMVSSSKSEKQTDNAKDKHAHKAGKDNIFQTEPNADHKGSNHGDVLLSIEDLIPGFVESNIASSTHRHSTNKVNKPGNGVAIDQSVEVTSPKPQKPKQHPVVTSKEKQQSHGPSKASTFQTVAQAANPDIFVKIKGEPIRFDQFFNIPSGSSSNSNGMVPTEVLRQLVNAELSISSEAPIVSTDINNSKAGKKTNTDVPIVKAKNVDVAEPNTHNVHSDHVIESINSKEMTPTVMVTEKLTKNQEIKPILPNIVPGIIATSIDTENIGLGGEMADNALHSHTGVISGNEIITDDISVLDVAMDKAHKEAHIREGDRANHQHLHDNLKTPFDPVRH